MNNIFTDNIKTIEFDSLIVGGGGSGMRASLELAKSGLKTAVVSKVFPTRSHTVSAQGGITCAIAKIKIARSNCFYSFRDTDSHVMRI